MTLCKQGHDQAMYARKNGRTTQCGKCRSDAGKARRLARGHRPRNVPHRPLEARFWEKVEMGEGCWTWTATTMAKGYGSFRINRPRMKIGAHRVAWMLATGRWAPEGMQVCHTCDNPACVRPDHLFLGTSHDNHMDMVRKGRSRNHLTGKLAGGEE